MPRDVSLDRIRHCCLYGRSIIGLVDVNEHKPSLTDAVMSQVGLQEG